MTQDGPTGQHASMREPFRSRGFAHEVPDEDAHPRFGTGSSFQALFHSRLVREALGEFPHLPRAQPASDPVFSQEDLVALALQPAISPDTFHRKPLLLAKPLNGRADVPGIAALLFLQLIIDDESFTGLAQPKLVSELHLGVALASHDDFHIRIVETQYFIFVRTLAASDDAIVGLVDRGRQLLENAFDALFDLADMAFAKSGFSGSMFKDVKMATGVSADAPGEFLHFPQHGFAMFATFFGAEFRRHLHAQGVHLAEEGERFPGHPMTKAGLANEDRRFHEGAHDVA